VAASPRRMRLGDKEEALYNIYHEQCFDHVPANLHSTVAQSAAALGHDVTN
jgi:hypothetical protein